MPPKKVDLKKEAKKTNDVEVAAKITEATLKDVCPKSVAARLKAAKSPAARADLLYMLDNNEMKELRKAKDEMDKFLNTLEAWFIQEFPAEQTGVAGKVGRVETKNKEIAIVEDWPAFYAAIKKKGEFELLNKAINQKAIKERWEQNKQVPGVGKFTKKVISLTGVKK